MHGLRTGPGYITGLMLQWQDGKQKNLWPKQLASGETKFPAFVKLPAPERSSGGGIAPARIARAGASPARFSSSVSFDRSQASACSSGRS